MLTKLFKVIDKIKRKYYSTKFKKYTQNINEVQCLGNVNLINRNIKVGKNVILYPNVSFEGNGKIELGSNVKIGTNTILHTNEEGRDNNWR